MSPFHTAPMVATASSFTIRIWIAGDYQEAKRILRDRCFQQGACYSIQPVDYIYSGGEEAGVCVTLINYPRFPKSPELILEDALSVAQALRVGLNQGSYTVETPEETRFVSWRKGDG